jgi:peptidoglycan L-alanyl-D-glutamate endopeptidase CwlK
LSKNLNDLHPYVKYLAEKFTAECRAKGLEPVITSTLRTMQEQTDIYAIGRTKPGAILSYTKAGYSMHNYGLAWDCSFPHNVDYKKAAAIGKKLGLTWGGDFKVRKNGKLVPFVDRPHFQWTGGLTTADLLKGKRPENPLEMTVKEFQKAFGLEADGIAGKLTKAKMNEVQALISKTLPVRICI